jgi:ferredoxin
MRARVNPEFCNEAGFCISSCPENDGTANAKMEETPRELQGRCVVAARSCPTEAISIEG